MLLKIIFGIVPGIIISIVFILLNKSKKKDYIYYLLCIILGAIGSYICYRFEMHFGSYFKEMEEMNYFEVFIYAIFGVAIFEEGWKWLVTNIALIIKKEKTKLDIMTISIITALGFAMFENVAFYINNNITGMLVRYLTAVPNHICNAIVMGYFLKKIGKNKKIYYLIGLIIPTITHAIYNTFIYKGDITISYFSLVYLFFLIIVCIKLYYNSKNVEN